MYPSRILTYLLGIICTFTIIPKDTFAHSSSSSSSCEKKLKKHPFSPDNSQFPRFGHDNANTFANLKEHTIKKSNVQNLVQKWNFVYAPITDTSDWFFTQPIIVCDTVYMLSGLGYLYALDIETGNLKSDFNNGMPIFVGAGPGGEEGGNAGSTPVVLGNYIYCATDDMKIRSFDRFTGSVNPHWPINGVPIPVYASSQAPSYEDALAQAEVQASLSIVDDGKYSLLFVTTSSSAEETAPPIAKGTVTAYDLKGCLVWSKVIALPNDDAMGAGGWSTPSFDTKRKLMFFGTSNPQNLPNNKYTDALQARDYRTGKLVWNYQYVSNDVSGYLYPFGVGNPVYLVDRDLGGSPNVFDVKHQGMKKHLVGANGKDGIYRAFDRSTGDLAWATVLTNTPSNIGNPSAAYANGILYTAIVSDSLPYFAMPITAANFTGYIGCDSGSNPGAVLTITSSNPPTLIIGQPIVNPADPNGVTPGTVVVAVGPIVNGNPTYILNIAQGVPETALAGYPLSPNLRSNYAYPSVDSVTSQFTLQNDNPLYFSSIARLTQGELDAQIGIVTALDAATGNVIWKKTFQTSIYGAPIYANGILYIGTYNGIIRALDAKNGDILQSWTTPPVPGAPTSCTGLWKFEIQPGVFISFPCNNPIPCLAVANGKLVVPYVSPSFGGFGGVIALGL